MALTVQSANAKDRRTAKEGVALQHRHFAFIAAVIKDMPSGTARLEAALNFSHALRSSNPNFDYDRFMRACGMCMVTEHSEYGVHA